MFVLLLFLALVCPSVSLETCRRLTLSGLGDPDGVYEALVDYRGRPDFFREDGLFNLYGEIDEGDTTYWELDNTQSKYPFYKTMDDSYHPIDIQTTWFIYPQYLEPSTAYPEFVCIDDESISKVLYVVVVSCVTLLALVLLILFHVIIRRRRLRKNSLVCPVCKKRLADVNRLVQRS